MSISHHLPCLPCQTKLILARRRLGVHPKRTGSSVRSPDTLRPSATLFSSDRAPQPLSQRLDSAHATFCSRPESVISRSPLDPRPNYSGHESLPRLQLTATDCRPQTCGATLLRISPSSLDNRADDEPKVLNLVSSILRPWNYLIFPPRRLLSQGARPRRSARRPWRGTPSVGGEKKPASRHFQMSVCWAIFVQPRRLKLASNPTAVI